MNHQRHRETDGRTDRQTTCDSKTALYTVVHHAVNRIKDAWKEYMEKLMNEENEWDHRISAGVKEGPADCIRIDEVAATLKKMKRQSLRLLRASSRNDTNHRGYWNSVDTGFT